jgi:hypothetical protein
LKDADRLDAYPSAESRGQGVAALASGTTAVLGAVLAAYDLRLPYVVTALGAATGAMVAHALNVDGPVHGSSTPRAARYMKDAAMLAFRDRTLVWSIAFAAFAVSASHVYYYLQQPYLQALAVPIGAFGLVFAGTKVVTAVVATRAAQIDAALGSRGATLAIAAAAALGLGTMSVASGAWGAALVLTRGLVDGLWMPLTNVYVNRLVPSGLRATMLSLQSLVARLSLAGVIGLAGVATAQVGLGTTLAFAAITVAAVGTILLATAPRLPEESRVIPTTG